LAVTNDVNDGPYSCFQIKIDKLKVNGVEYTFPQSDGCKFFGNPSPIWSGGHSDYPENFSGITMTNSTQSLKTILTVDKEIIGSGTGYEASGIASDPYKFIKVRGELN